MMLVKNCLAGMITIAVGLLTSCTLYSGTSLATLSPIEQSPPVSQSFTPAPTIASPTVIEPPRTPVPVSTLTFIPTQTSLFMTALPALDIKMLKERSSGEYRFVVTAFWSEDGSIVYYGLDTGEALMPRSPKWFAINLHTREEKELSTPPLMASPPNFYPAHIYPQYEGFVSPSGHYRLDIVSNFTAESYSSLSKVASTLWLIDTTGEEPGIEVLKAADLFYRRAYWFPGERGVIFGVGPEFGTYLYLFDLDTEKLTPISELTGFNYPGPLEWSVSPDGKKIAVVDGSGNLQILSLEGKPTIRFPGFFQNVRWSHNSQLLYYFRGPDWYVLDNLMVYNLDTEDERILFHMQELDERGIAGFFEVSPGDDQIIFWGKHIWVCSI